MATRTRPRAKHPLDVVDAPVAGLRAWDGNPRRIAPARLEQLKAMLEESPEMLRARPLIALPDGTVIAGNQRFGGGGRARLGVYSDGVRRSG